MEREFISRLSWVSESDWKSGTDLRKLVLVMPEPATLDTLALRVSVLPPWALTLDMTVLARRPRPAGEPPPPPAPPADWLAFIARIAVSSVSTD